MQSNSLEKRLTAIEVQLAELKAAVDKLAQPKDWRSAVGMFAGDEVMKRIDEAGRKIREKDRERARKAAQPKRKKARA